MKTTTAFELEFMRHDVTPAQFLAYLRQMQKKHPEMANDFSLGVFAAEGWSCSYNDGTPNTKPCAAETVTDKPYEKQTYVMGFDGSVYNEIIEFQFWDEKIGTGYYYTVQKDVAEEDRESNKAEYLNSVARRAAQKIDRNEKKVAEIREDLEKNGKWMADYYKDYQKVVANGLERDNEELAEIITECTAATTEATESAEVAETEEDTTTNTNINEKENDTMTTNNNTITETITETAQQKTDRENWEHCKAIALDIDKVAEGSAYRCPHCGEIIFWDDDQYNDEDALYTCPECGETFDECDLEPVSLYDYFSDVYDIEYRIGSDRQFRSVRLMVACGGPNIYIDTASGNVELYWWTDRVSYSLSSDTIDAINAEFEEIYACC